MLSRRIVALPASRRRRRRAHPLLRPVAGRGVQAPARGTWGNAYGFGQVLYKATTLIFTGLAVGLGLRAGLFNIGAESQLAAGGFCAALVGMLLPAGIPALLCLPLYSSPPRSAAASSAPCPACSRRGSARTR